MQYFQPILIVVGLLAIGGVLIHGYLLSRKEKSAIADAPANVDFFAEKSTAELEIEKIEETDDIISDVRIVNAQEDEAKEENIDFSQALDDDEKIESFEFSESTNDDAEAKTIELETIEALDADDIEIKTENEPEVEVQFTESVEQVDVVAEQQEEVIQPPELFIFNVVAKEDEKLGGHELLQFFLTSGFRFGDMSIFHRHQHSDGKGPILFSIANMMAPGVFDPENMEQFKSEGVSFFLTAPNKEINIKESFDMMLRAVEQMAEEFDCIVLNAEREPLTKAQFVEYNNRLLHYI